VHIKSQEDSETGRTVYKPGLQGAMQDEIAAYVDLALLMVARPVNKVVDGATVREVARFLQTYPDAQHPWVKDRSGKLPMEFPIDFNSDYERMQQLIYANMPAAAAPVTSNIPPTQTPPPPSPPQRTTGAAKTGPDQQPSLPDAPAATPPAPESQPSPQSAEAETPDGTDAPPTEPAPEPVTAPEPAPEPEPSAEPPAEESVPETGTTPETGATGVETAVEDWQKCQGCGGLVENKDQADLSFIRHHEHLCRKCFAERKNKKK
jgi:hypothetical protein